ncbi:MAG: hypothetical protein ACXVQS_06450, partial [Actinomycetota bacterium]
MEDETDRTEAREAPAEQPDIAVAPSRQEELNTGAADSPAAATTGTGVPKKRRRGRRGGKRHRRKTPGTATAAGTATAEQPAEGAEEGEGIASAPKPRAPRAQRAPRAPSHPRQPRQAQPRARPATRDAAPEAGAATTETDNAEPEAESGEARDLRRVQLPRLSLPGVPEFRADDAAGSSNEGRRGSHDAIYGHFRGARWRRGRKQRGIGTDAIQREDS